MLQKQMMRSFRISWRSFDIKTNKPLIDILEPSKNIYNSWLNQTFCTIGQNQTLEKSVSVNTTQFKDEQKTGLGFFLHFSGQEGRGHWALHNTSP